MEDIIVSGVLMVISLFLFIVSIRSFLEKGFLFNHAYLYASKKEREAMNKKPYYRQTAILFFLMGLPSCLLDLQSFLMPAGSRILRKLLF